MMKKKKKKRLSSDDGGQTCLNLTATSPVTLSKKIKNPGMISGKVMYGTSNALKSEISHPV